MNTLTVDKKKYVVIPQEDYENLMKKLAIKTPSARKLSLAEGKRMAYSMIDKWHKGK
jgi:hypothetical protein